mgnify:CR=1 FL=1
MKTNIRYYIYLLSLFTMPIILANYYYIDDMGRASSGYLGWGKDGRPLSDAIMYIVNIGTPITDIAPLTVVISIAILSLSMSKWQSFVDNNASGFFIVASFMANPYLAENFSYRFDVLPMMAGISLAFLGFSINTRSVITKTIITVAIFISSLATYQVNVNIICALVICEFAINAQRWPITKSINNLLLRISQVFISIYIYLAIILPISFNGNHVENHPGIAEKSIIRTILNNLYDYFYFIDETFIYNFKALICLFLLISIISSVVIIKKVTPSKSKAYDIFFYISILSSPFLIIILCVGSLLALENTIVYFTRLYIGVSFVFIYLSICLNIIFKSIKIRFLCFLLMVFPSISYFYTYGNAIREQSIYTKIIISQVSSIAYNELSDSNPNLFFNGSGGKSKFTINAENKYPLIKYSIPNYFRVWYWPIKAFEMNGVSVKFTTDRRDLNKNWCVDTLIKKTQNFDVIFTENSMIVDFEKKCHQ